MTHELAYWASIGLAAIAAIALFKLLAASAVGDSVPGLRPLAELI